jgi:hypothetical protein
VNSLTLHFAIRDPRTLRSLRSAEPPAMPTARGFIPDNRRTSAHVSDAPLGCFLAWHFWLCRKLKYRCLLPFAQICQENTGAIRKLEGIVMHPRLVFVDLPKDRRPDGDLAVA